MQSKKTSGQNKKGWLGIVVVLTCLLAACGSQTESLDDGPTGSVGREEEIQDFSNLTFTQYRGTESVREVTEISGDGFFFYARDVLDEDGRVLRTEASSQDVLDEEEMEDLMEAMGAANISSQGDIELIQNGPNCFMESYSFSYVSSDGDRNDFDVSGNVVCVNDSSTNDVKALVNELSGLTSAHTMPMESMF